MKRVIKMELLIELGDIYCRFIGVGAPFKRGNKMKIFIKNDPSKA